MYVYRARYRVLARCLCVKFRLPWNASDPSIEKQSFIAMEKGTILGASAIDLALNFEQGLLPLPVVLSDRRDPQRGKASLTDRIMMSCEDPE
jgi:hypothetical protein